MGEPEKPRCGLLLAVCGSLSVHGLFLAVGLTLPEPEPGEVAESLKLVPVPLIEPTNEPSDNTRLTTPSSLPEPPAVAERSPVPEERQASPATTADQPPDERPSQTADLRQQILELAGQVESEPRNGHETLNEISRLPRLPGNTGWMNRFVGTVATGREHWQDLDGSIHSRTVLSSGQVVCTAIRPPTMSEFFNPWMSTAVVMMRNCGREQPADHADSQDPWRRTPATGK